MKNKLRLSYLLQMFGLLLLFSCSANSEQLNLEKKAIENLEEMYPGFGFGFEQNDKGYVHKVFFEDSVLTEIPEEIRIFKELEILTFTSNQISNLPNWLIEFKKLRNLGLSKNHLSYIPDVVYLLENLESLNLSYNDFEEIEYKGVLCSLRRLMIAETPLKSFPIIDQPEGAPPLYLNLSGTQITEIPKEVGQMKISELWMSNNVLEYIAPEIGDIEELYNIVLSGSPKLGGKLPETLGNCKLINHVNFKWCGLTEFPMFITELTNMQTMSLDNNLISEIPPEIGNLQKLSTFMIKENRLTTLPKEFNKLPRLSYLGLEYNQISSLPAEMFDIRRKKPCVLVLEGNAVRIPVTQEQFKKGYKHYGVD